MIKIICINNPFEPMAERHVQEAELAQHGRPLRDYLVDAQLDSPQIRVSVNGHVYDQEQQRLVIPLDGDCIVMALHVGNSGIFKALGAVAVLALATVVSGGLATGPLAALGAGALGSAFSAVGLGGISAFGASLIAAGVTIGGNLLVSAIAGALTPAAKSASPSYDADGPTSLAQSGTVIPKGYGKFMWGGNCIGNFSDFEGQDSYINWLGCYGYGPVRSLTLADITINGKPIGEYQNIQVILRLGTNDQTPIPNFNRIVNGYPQNTECLAGIPVVVPGIGTETLIGQLDIQFPDGVFKRTNDGNTIPVVLTYKVEYSAAGINDWQPVVTPRTTVDVVTYDVNGVPNTSATWVVVATDLPPSSGVVYATDSGSHTPGDQWTGTVPVEVFQPNGNHTTYNKACTGEWQPLDPTLNQVQVTEWNDGYIEFDGASLQALYNRTTVYYPSKAKWDLRVTKYGSALLHDDVTPGDNFDPTVGQDMWVHQVNEITPIDLSYPGMILIGVRALATSQLNGANLQVLATITHGCRTRDTGLLPAQLAIYEDDNPAVVAADMMLDRLYGGGRGLRINPANILRYIDEWVAWAELNDQLPPDGNGGSIRRHVFRGVFDTESTLWEQLTVVGGMSRAQVLQFGRDYGVYVDQEDVPVQMFSMGNIGLDSFTESFLELDSRANQVEIQFADSTRYYKSDNPMVYMDPGFQNAGVVTKNTRIRANGVVVPAQAWHLARFRERCNEFILRSGSFTCDVEAIACRPGNVIILQHDVPEWGWGGKTLLGCTLTTLIIDRLDLVMPASPGTASVILLYPAILQYSGTVSAVAPVVDSTGASVGTMLTLSSFDNLERVVRAIITNPAVSGVAAEPVDCAIKNTAAGTVTVQPPPGFTPAVNATYQLFDTDVLVSRAVSSIALKKGQQVLTLASPLPLLPEDFTTYFFGPTGSQKLARVTLMRKMSDFRFKIEWADYDANIYVDAVPTFGSTISSPTTNPGVTSLTGSEVFNKVGGSYIASVVLSWRNGPDTVGVGIYASYPAVSGRTAPQQIARLTGAPTSYTFQAVYGEPVQYTVVGFDSDDDYAGFGSAPSVTVAAVGVADNLLLGSNFTSGFTYWNITPRAGDTFLPALDNDGEADYTVLGTTLTVAQLLCYQVIQPSKWAVGDYLMLSPYLLDSCLSPTAPNVGTLVATLTFRNASNAEISHVDVSVPLSGVSPTLTRASTASAQIPTGTVSVVVSVSVAGTGLSIPVGSILTLSHLLLEISTAGQTLPREWADIDVAGHIQDLFTTGSSTGLRVQGSTVPSFTGNFSFTFTDTTASIPWASLVILWPDGAYTYVQDGSQAFTGLTASSKYFAYPYFDMIYGGVRFVTPTTALGTPALLSATYDAVADAACRQDGRVPLAAGGLTFTTAAAGATGGGTGGGGTGTGGSGGGPIEDPGRPIEQE